MDFPISPEELTRLFSKFETPGEFLSFLKKTNPKSDKEIGFRKK